VWKPRAQNCCLRGWIDGPSILPNAEIAQLHPPNPSIPGLPRACSLCRTINKYYYIISALFPRPKRCPGGCYSLKTISGSVAIFRTSSNIPLPNPALPALPRACSLCRTIDKYYYIISALFPRPKRCPGGCYSPNTILGSAGCCSWHY